MKRDDGEPAALVERDLPLLTLERAWRGAQTRGGQIVLVLGEAGIGKSSLLQAFLAKLPDPGSAVTGWCDPMHTPRPLGPVRDLARRLLGPERGEPDEARHFDGLLHRLARRPRGPNRVHVLVLEDLHWVDQRSADWLQFVARRLAPLPLLIVASCRDGPRPPDHPLDAVLGTLPAARLERIALQPLTPGGVRELGRQLGVGKPAEAVHLLTGGNPFLARELLLQAPPSPPAADGLQAPPDTVADAVQARLAGGAQALRTLVELVACSPAGMPLARLHRTASNEESAQIDEAVRRQLLQVQGQQLRFRHELTRLAVLDRLPPTRRRAAHRRLLQDLLAQQGDAQALDLIVHHARGAGANDVLLTHAPRAADKAAAFGAHREAARHLADAVEAAAGAPPEVAAAVLERWAYEASLAQGVDERMLAARHEAIRLWRLAGRADKVGENLAGLARMHRYRGEAAQAQAFIEQAVELLASQAPSVAQARALAWRAQFCMLQGRMDEALDWGQRALRIAEDIGDVEIRAHALNTLGVARLLRDDAGGETLLRASLDLALRHGQHEQAARAYTNLAEGLMAGRALVRAEAVIAAGLAFDAAHDFGRWIDYLVGRQAQLRFEQERYAEALAIAQGVLAQPQPLPIMRMPALIVRAGARLRLGESGAEDALAEALAVAERIHEPQYLVVLRIAQIEAAVLAGQPAQAEAAMRWLAGLDPAMLGPRRRGECNFWRRLAGEPALPDGVGAGGSMPPAFVLSAAGRHEDAAAAFDAEGSIYLGAWSRLTAARLRPAADATALLQQADAAFAAVQARAARSALQRDFRGLAPGASRPAPRGPYAAARSHPYGLTAREQQVLRLVTDGHDNRAIAQHLRRSRRTVENHVSAVLSKLLARNRLELVLRVQREPWILDPPGPGP